MPQDDRDFSTTRLMPVVWEGGGLGTSGTIQEVRSWYGIRMTRGPKKFLWTLTGLLGGRMSPLYEK